jgi:uncharacterized protein (TIGR02147 family)
MTIFEFDDYKKFVEARIRDYPSGGRGVFKLMAEAMKVPRSTLSQVFNGERDLTFEQAIDLAGFLELNVLETEFFMALVERSRAGNARLRSFSEKKIDAIRQKSKTLAGRIPKKAVVTDKEKSVFYSEWYYSAIRLLCALPQLDTIPALAAHLGLPIGRTKQVMEFLVSCGLCVQEKDSYKMGPSTTHIGSDDPLVFRHHQNWRQQAARRFMEYPYLEDDELCVTIPCTTSPETMTKLRKLLMEAVLKITEQIDTSKEEHLAFVNIDLLRIKGKNT